MDEFQDVNLLQWTLLELWLGERDDLCVVGDDHQAIYSFTGATPRYLLDLPRRFPDAIVVRLEENYRSTPEVLALANRLVAARSAGRRRRCGAVRRTGPSRSCRRSTARRRRAFVVERIEALRDEGVPLGEIAVLYRTNARSAGVRAGARRRRGSRSRCATAASSRGRRRGGSARGCAASRVDGRRGAPSGGRRGGGAPARRRRRSSASRSSSARPTSRASSTSRSASTTARARSRTSGPTSTRGSGRARSRPAGVQLLTLHRAKGLEFEAVFLPRLEENELPIRQAKSPEEVAEERRLLYVGITRAKRWLYLTWSSGAAPSRFLVELGLAEDRPRRSREAGAPRREPLPDTPAVQALREWRRERAKADGVPAYVVFHDATLAEIAARRPSSHADLASVPGIGPTKLERYGDDLLAALATAA